MIPLITDALIEEATQTPNMVIAGRSYWRKGAVTALEFDDDDHLITANVSGSARRPYWVNVIFFEPGQADEIVETDCSCPVGYGCKHGAAVLFAAREHLPRSISFFSSANTNAKPIVALPPPPLPKPLQDWLTDTKSSVANAQACLLPVSYVLVPQRLFPGKAVKAKVAVALPLLPALPHRVTVTALVDGLDARRDAYRFNAHYPQAERGGATTAPIDQWLIQRLRAYDGDFDHGGGPRGAGGTEWIYRALATGRMHWRKSDGLLLHRGEDQARSFIWVSLPDGHQRLTLEGLAPEHILVAAAPPMIVDEKTGAVHVIETGVAPDLAARLLAMPPIPPPAVQQMGEAWGKIAGDAVPAPGLPNLVELGMIQPVPVLTLRDENVDVFLPQRSRYYAAGVAKERLAFGRVSFDYDGQVITQASQGTDVVHAKQDGFVRFSRDLRAESDAFGRIRETPLCPLSIFPELKTKAAQEWDFALSHDARPLDYLFAVQGEIDTLRAEGWRVETASNWDVRLVEVDADSFGFAVEESGAVKGSGIDWFDISLDARIDDQLVDILPLLRDLLAKYGPELLDSDGDTLTIALSAGRYAQLPMEKLRPVLAMLLQLALKDGSASGPLRLPRHDLAALADLEAASAAHIPWSGAAPLRALAKALTQIETKSITPPKNFKATLRPYQQQGLDWLQALHGAGFGGVLADDMGLGKTVQTLAHIACLKADKALKSPVLIVAPTSVLPNWQSEIAQFTPHLSCLLWHGNERRSLKDQFAAHDIILTSYPLLARDVALFEAETFSLAILDEAHVLKNAKTAGFKAAKKLTASQIIALTGTPVENQLSDAWSLMELVTPNLLGKAEAFNRTYVKPITKDNDPGVKATLRRRLRPFMLRRTKDAVAKDLPAKTEMAEWIDLEPDQHAAYESLRLLMQKRVRDEIARVGLMRSHIIFLDALLKLRQICCDPRLLPHTGAKPAGSAKMTRLLEMLPELLSEGRAIILFSQFTSMLDLIKPELEALGIKYAEIRGDTKDRQTPVLRFQTKQVPLILVSLKAGGTGLNLTTADTVILYDPWWNPAVEAQAIDRAHRIGQTKPVFVHRLIARGSIEEKILSLQDKKRALAAMLWEGSDAAPAKLSEADMAFLLS